MCAKNNSVHDDLLLLFTAHTRIRSKLVILLYLYILIGRHFILLLLLLYELPVCLSTSHSLSLSLSLFRLCLYHDRIPFLCSCSFISNLPVHLTAVNNSNNIIILYLNTPPTLVRSQQYTIFTQNNIYIYYI